MVKPADLQEISGRLERGEIDSAQFLELLTRFIAQRIGCSRSGVRIFVSTAQGRALRCVAMFDANLDRMVVAPDLYHADADYVGRLQRDGHVTVADADRDAVEISALCAYVRGLGIGSFMDMSFSVNGLLYGTFSCEQIGKPIDWTQRQLQQLRKIASRASLALMHVVNASVDTSPGALWEASTPNRLATDAGSDRPPARMT